MELTQREINNISLGFQWNKDMDFHDFMKANKNSVEWDHGYFLYKSIEMRYITYVYENNKQ
jgi:hypothetical protein